MTKKKGGLKFGLVGSQYRTTDYEKRTEPKEATEHRPERKFKFASDCDMNKYGRRHKIKVERHDLRQRFDVK